MELFGGGTPVSWKTKFICFKILWFFVEPFEVEHQSVQSVVEYIILLLLILDIKKSDTKYPSFFFPWKSKVPVKAIFAHFFDFLHGWKICFTGTFFDFSPFSSRVEEKFSRVEFHGLPAFFSRVLLAPPGICFFWLFSPDQRMVIGCVFHFLHLFMTASRTLQKYFHPFAYRLSAFFVVVFSPVDQAVIGGVCNSLHFYTKI